VQFTLKMCAAAKKITKKHKHPLSFKVQDYLRSFEVIDVDTIQKLVTSACYDKQHACAYLQLFLR